MLLRDGWPLLALGAAVFAVFLLVPRPHDAALDAGRLPDTAAATAPELRELRGLSVAARGGLPAFRAERARPFAGGGPLTIGGLVTALSLDEVLIELPGGEARIEAAHARFDGESLELESLRLRRGERTLLVGGRARLADGRLVFDGLAVTAPDGAGRRSRLDADFGLDELAQLATAGR